MASPATSTFVPGEIAVTLHRSAPLNRADELTAMVRGTRGVDLDFDSSNVITRVIHVQPGTETISISSLRSQANVVGASRVGYRSHLSIAANDPYYAGFPGTTAPYYEAPAIPGQWDMHVINVAGAWNELTSTPPVVGSSAPIAVVDTGVDVTHPDLSGGKIIRTRCFVSYPAGTAQTTGQYITDTSGHGTNIAGIASADTDNSLGFAGSSYDAKLLGYRIFPTEPAGGCEGTNSTNPQCQADTVDEASAINDAVANGAKVISLSLGSTPPCSSNDPEYLAVENAISHNVTVVAAAGNGDSAGNGEPVLDCPAADPGVIAVGATGLDDSNPLSINEVLAPYSNYLPSSNGRFLLAPGGNATSSGDSDNLHWIENLYSSAAADSADFCKIDFGTAQGSTVDCRGLFIGTSQATPHVSGVAAMILTARPNYTPGQVATALCASADSIGDLREGCGRVDANAAVAYALAH